MLGSCEAGPYMESKPQPSVHCIQPHTQTAIPGALQSPAARSFVLPTKTITKRGPRFSGNAHDLAEELDGNSAS